MQLPDFVILSSYLLFFLISSTYFFSWESPNIFCCVISWQLVPKQYGMVFPSKPISLLQKLSGGFQQPLRCGSGHSFSFHLRSDWEDADAFIGKGETVVFSLSNFTGVDKGSVRGWKSLSMLFFPPSAFVFMGVWVNRVLRGKDNFVNGMCQQK